MKAASLLTEGDDAAAESIYRKLVKLELNNSDAFIGLAGAQFGQFNVAGSRENYSKALVLDPTNPEAFYGAGAVERMAGAPQKAKAFINRHCQYHRTMG